jgi:anti-sigma B factor antagonist
MPVQHFEARLRQPMMHLRRGMIIDMFGEINGSVEHALNTAYHKAEADNPEIIILNFSDVQYINSTGIALIVGLLAKARREKRILAVYGLSEHYMELFSITRLADFMTMFPDEESAISEIASTTTQKVD